MIQNQKYDIGKIIRCSPGNASFAIVLVLLICGSFKFRLDFFGEITDETAMGLYEQRSSAISPDNKLKRFKILIWGRRRRKINWTLTDSPECGGGCDIIRDRNEAGDCDAIVFFMKTSFRKDMPDQNTRPNKQVYIWWSHESPWTTSHRNKKDLHNFDNIFNWTMTFRVDSDIIASFLPVPALDYVLYRLGRYEEMYDKRLADHPPISVTRFDVEFKQLLSMKTGMAAWVASVCQATHLASFRMRYIRDLKNIGLSVTEFGKCANNPLPYKMTTLLETISRYKFYMAFENSRCLDYVTEKFYYNGLIAGAVPVVNGPTREDVEKIAPSGSFIHVDDFSNKSELVKFLKYLDKNITAYKEYFRWWRSPGAHVYPRFRFNYGSNLTYIGEEWTTNAVQEDMADFERIEFCHLCRKLRNGDNIRTSKVLPGLHEIWYGRETQTCSAKKFERGI